jgi:hypothetical protein
MDGSHFDTLVKRLATTRLTRGQTVRGLAVSGVAALAGLRLVAGETEAKGKGKGKRRKKKPVCVCSASGCQSQKVTKPSSLINQDPRCTYAGECTTNPCAAEPPSPPGCVPEPLETTCAAGCGRRTNNCNQEVGCVCPSGQACLVNGTCARPCSSGGQCTDCTPSGLTGCSLPTAEGAQHCIPFGVCEDRPLCTPPDTTGCPLGFQCMICNPMGAPSNRCVPVAVCPAS